MGDAYLERDVLNSDTVLEGTENREDLHCLKEPFLCLVAFLSVYVSVLPSLSLFMSMCISL